MSKVYIDIAFCGNRVVFTFSAQKNNKLCGKSMYLYDCIENRYVSSW